MTANQLVRNSNFHLDFNSTLIISDCHLCASNCQIDILQSVVEEYSEKVEAIIIAGDLFDSIDNRIPKKHWKFLNLLRKLSNDIEIFWVLGNHDKPHPEVIASILGITISDKLRFVSNGNAFFVIHGDEFDEFITQNKILTFLADKIYQFLQYIDSSHYLAKYAKRTSKLFLRSKEKIAASALKTYGDQGIVIAGHTHFAEIKSGYINLGCFTELPCSFLYVENGVHHLIYKDKV